MGGSGLCFAHTRPYEVLVIEMEWNGLNWVGV